MVDHYGLLSLLFTQLLQRLAKHFGDRRSNRVAQTFVAHMRCRPDICAPFPPSVLQSALQPRASRVQRLD